MSTVGGRIHAARVAKGLTMDQLADKLGVTKGAIAQWESNKIKRLTAENLFNLSKTLEVSANWLLEWKDENGNPIPMGKPTHLEPDESDLVETFRVLEPRFRDELINEAHKYLRLSASQHPSRTNPYPKAPKPTKPRK